MNPLPFRVHSLDKACPLKAYKADPLSHTDSKTILSQWLQKWQGLNNYFTMVQFSSVKPIIRAQLHRKFFGRSSGRKEKQNRTWLFTLVLVSHSILIATHTVFTYTIKKILLLVFQPILHSSFRNAGVGVNVHHALTLSCHNPCGKSVKTGLCMSWHSSLASNFVRRKSNCFGVHDEITLSHLNLQVKFTSQKLSHATSLQ